jgi:hypothetical protein
MVSQAALDCHLQAKKERVKEELLINGFNPFNMT